MKLGLREPRDYNYSLSLSKEMRDRLVAAAKRADRSLHGEIINRLRNSLVKQTDEAAAA